MIPDSNKNKDGREKRRRGWSKGRQGAGRVFSLKSADGSMWVSPKVSSIPFRTQPSSLISNPFFRSRRLQEASWNQSQAANSWAPSSAASCRKDSSLMIINCEEQSPEKWPLACFHNFSGNVAQLSFLFPRLKVELKLIFFKRASYKRKL